MTSYEIVMCDGSVRAVSALTARLAVRKAFRGRDDIVLNQYGAIYEVDAGWHGIHIATIRRARR